MLASDLGKICLHYYQPREGGCSLLSRSIVIHVWKSRLLDIQPMEHAVATLSICHASLAYFPHFHDGRFSLLKRSTLPVWQKMCDDATSRESEALFMPQFKLTLIIRTWKGVNEENIRAIFKDTINHAVINIHEDLKIYFLTKKS